MEVLFKKKKSTIIQKKASKRNVHSNGSNKRMQPRILHSFPKTRHSNILKNLQPKKEHFQTKRSDIVHISALNIDCGYSLEPPRQGGSNEYP